MESMPEPESPIRSITARDLSRATRSLLEEVQGRSRTLMIVRRGYPVALVTPIPVGWFESHVPWIQAEEEPVERELLEELTPIQKDMLELLSDGRPHGNPVDELRAEDPSKAGVGLVHLEFKRLVTRGMFGYFITRDGERVVRALVEEDESEEVDAGDESNS